MKRSPGIVTAMHDAIEHEMRRDESVIFMGVDAHLGIWGYSRGLAAEFGKDRVRATPITEYAVTGAGLGAAITGLRPIVDLHWANFMYAAWDQIADQIAKLPYMTNGQVSAPLVLIGGAGSCGNAGQHSDVPTSALCNLGGLIVVYVTSPEDAAGLMTAAIRSDEPVVFLYPGAMGSERGESGLRIGEPIPFGEARVRRSGSDITCWAAGQMVKRALKAAELVESEGISVEVIDPRTLNPLDEATVLASVGKTRRFVAVDEAHRSACMGSEIVARVAQEMGRDLQRNPILVAAPDNVTIPYAPRLEKEIVPTVERIADAFRAAVG